MPEVATSASAVLDRLAAGSPSATEEKPASTEVVDPTKGTSATPAEPVIEEKPDGDGQTPEETPSEPEPEPDLEEASPESGDFSKFKDSFKVHPELRSIVGREAAYSELFPKFSEAKQIREWFPTLEDAETVVRESSEHRTMGETFRSDPEAYLESLKESDSGAYSKLIRTIPDILARTDPDTYSHHARTYTNHVLENLLYLAQQNQNQELFDAVQKVALDGLGVRLGAGVPASRNDPRDAELERLRAKDREREQGERESQFQSFHTAVQSDFTEQTLGEIENTVKTAFKDAPPTDGVMKRIVREIYDSLQKRMQSQPQTVAQVNSTYDAARKGKVGVAEHKAIVDFLVRRAKTSIPLIAKDIIGEWTQFAVSKSQSEIDKKKGIAERTKDAGSGVGAGASTSANGRPASRPQGNKPRSADDIFREIDAGTYRG